MELIVATHNKKKLEEIKALLRDLNLKITSLRELKNSPSIVEDGKTFIQNALKKAATISMWTKRLTLAEDSGLVVPHLKGKPGIYSSRFSGEKSSDKKNNLKLLRLLKNTPLEKRTAYYRCVVALCDKDKIVAVSKGSCRGLIAFRAKGKYGFGYDPVFIVPKYKKTFAQLGPEIKNKLSHRAKALKKIKPIILKYLRRENL